MQGSATQYLSVLLEPYSLLRSLQSASKLLYNCPHLVLGPVYMEWGTPV